MPRKVSAANLLAAHAEKNRAPTTVTFQVTDKCNYSCEHCYQEHKDQDELSTAEIFGILDQLAEGGILFLTLMGGEYFMRRDADDILKYAHELGFALKLMTTGHHVHDKRADFLATVRPLQVDMSMYGSKPEVHEHVTRAKGSWKRTYSAAVRLLERGVPVHLKAPVMASNVDDLERLSELADSMGATWSFDPKVTAIENGDQAPVSLRMSGERLQRFYSEEMGDHTVDAFGAVDLNHEDPNKRPRALSHSTCAAAQQACSINQRGEVWPCNSLPISAGSLREQTFAEIWYGSSELGKIRDLRWASISECSECKVRQFCNRCHGMALTEHGKMTGPSLEACRHAVAVRNTLRERGLVPADHNHLPPTWDRVDVDGQHTAAPLPAEGISERARRSTALRVVE